MATTGTVEDGSVIMLPHEGMTLHSGKPGVAGDRELEQRICAALGVPMGSLPEMVGCLPSLREYKTMCEVTRRLERRCNSLEELLRQNCCPANRLYGRPTLDEFSTESQIDIDQIVSDYGQGYVNQLPLAPGQKVRLQQQARPGYIPRTIQVDLSLANNGTNYLDIRIQFYVGPGGKAEGKKIGPRWRGNQFLNKNGTQIIKEFPEWRSCEIEVGSAEFLAVEIEHIGNANNLDSVFVTVGHDASAFHKLCDTSC